MSTTIHRKRQGISTLLAVIITIGIVVALGTSLFAWAGRLFKTRSAVAEITITEQRYRELKEEYEKETLEIESKL